MKFFRSTLFKTLLLLAVIGGLGYLGVWWSTESFSQKRQALQKMVHDNTLLLQKGASMQKLNASSSRQKELDRELEKIKPMLAEIWKLNASLGEDPNAWKQSLNQALEQWNKDFPSQEKFYYGFSDYHLNLPDAQQTRDLEIQLGLIRELLSILKKSNIVQLKAVRRAPAGDNEKSDLIPQKIESSPVGKIYPFELEFSCRPQAVRRVLNNLLASSFLFCPQMIEVKNAADPKKTLAALQKNEKLPLISGDEDVDVKITGAFCLWDAY